MSTAGQTSGKTCFKCQKPCDHITGLGLKDGRYVHNACFVCELCFVALPSTFVTKNGRHFHVPCYQNCKNFPPPCRRCGGLVEPASNSVHLGGGISCHKDCFICDMCRLPLDSKNPRQFASDPSGGIYHTQCYVCSWCGNSLQNQIFGWTQLMTIQCQTCLTNPAIQMNLLQQQQQMQLMQQSDMQNALLMQQQQHIQNAEFMQHQESQNQVLMQYREPFVEQPQIQPPVVPVKSDIPANTDQQVVKQPEVVQPVEPQKPNNDNSKSVVNPMVSNEAQQVPTADIVQDAKPADPNKLNRDKSGSSFLPRLNDKDSKPNRESNDMILANKSKERLTNLGGNAIDTTPNPSSVPAKNPALQPILGHKVLLTPLGSKAGVNKLPGLNVGNRSSPSLPDPNDPSVAVASKLLSLGNIKRNPDI